MKQLLFIFLFTSTSIFANEINQTQKRDSIVNYAKTYLTVPYVWGGTSPSGFDCTGFLYYVYKKFSIKVSRASSGYQNTGTTINLKDAKPADIFLFTGTDASKRKVGHVGMVISNVDGVVKFIHSSSSKRHFGVCITTYNNSGYVKRFLRVISIL